MAAGVLVVNFEHISHLVLVFLLLTLNMWLLTGKVIQIEALRNLLKIKEINYINYFELMQLDICGHTKLIMILLERSTSIVLPDSLS